MRNRIFNLIVTVVLLMAPLLSFGHAGHGTSNGINFWHYLTSPLHVISFLAVVAVIGLSVHFYRRRQTN